MCGEAAESPKFYRVGPDVRPVVAVIKLKFAFLTSKSKSGRIHLPGAVIIYHSGHVACHLPSVNDLALTARSSCNCEEITSPSLSPKPFTSL